MPISFPFVSSLAFLACAVLSGSSGCGNSQETPAETVVPADAKQAKEKPVAPVKVKEPRYEDTRSGLERLMRNLRVAIQSEDEKQTVVLLKSLRLSDADTWMKTTFGDELGKTLSEKYVLESDEIGIVASVLKEQFALGRTEITTERFESAEAELATGYQSEAIKKMQTPVGLYSVRFRSKDGTKSFHFWSFVHDKKSFRYVGKLRAAGTKKLVKGRDLSEFRIRDVERISSLKK